MGTCAAQCMHNAMAAEDDRLEAGLNFELFTHVTRFYGKKVRWCLQHCWNVTCGPVPCKSVAVTVGTRTPGVVGSPVLQVILLGLYNGQRLDAEPSRDIVTYARSVEVWHWQLDEMPGAYTTLRICHQQLTVISAAALQGPDSTFVRVLLLRGRMQARVV